MKQKALLPLLIILSVLTVLFTVSATAATVSSGKCGTNLTYTLDDAGTLTISGTGAMTNWSDYTIAPAPWYSYSGLIKNVVITGGVTSIGNYAFRECDSLTSIEIPNSVTSIGNFAFSRCDSLTSIEIPASVTSIGNYAFCFCYSLTSIEIPNSVTSIGSDAFSYCDSLTSIEIPNSVTSIGDLAFCDCDSLTSIEIPNSVTSIGNHTFYDCDSLTSIEIPNSVTSIGEGAFNYCDSLTDVYYTGTEEQWNSITIRSFNTPLLNATIHFNHGVGETYIASGECGANMTWKLTEDGTLTISGTGDMTDWSYSSDVPWYYSSHNSIKKVIIENGVTSIGSWAFYNCDSLISVSFAENSQLTSIGDYAFNGCSSLTSIEIPNSVTSIGRYAFCYCDSLTSIEIPNSVTSIGDFAFCDCDSLTSIEIPNSVTSIGDFAFYECTGLTSIEIPNSVTSIGRYAFSYLDSLTSITIPNSVTSIVYGAFSGCYSLESIKIPNSVTSIGDEAFYNCDSLASITIPNSVTSIGNYAFSYCYSLTSIEIPASVTSIGGGAFDYCDSLTDVYYTGTEEQWNSITIGSSNTPLKNATIHFNYGKRNGMTLSETELKAFPMGCRTISVYHLDGKTPYSKSFKVISSDPMAVKPIRDGNEILLEFNFTGKATVTAYATDGSGDIAICSVEVKEAVETEETYLLKRLALCQLVYSNELEESNDINGDITVEDLIANKHEDMFYLSVSDMVKVQKESYERFYSRYINDYKIIKLPESPEIGFYAAAFEAPDGKIIIAYRGSEGSGISGIFMRWDKNEIDWWGTNLPMFLQKELSSQFKQALDFYDKVRNDEKNKGKEITLTGHSLGGALASYVAINRNVRCDNINGATGWIFNRGLWQEYITDYVGADKYVNENFNVHGDIANTAVTRWSGQGIFNYSSYADSDNYNGIATFRTKSTTKKTLVKDYHKITSIINFSDGGFTLTRKKDSFSDVKAFETNNCYIGTSESESYIAFSNKKYQPRNPSSLGYESPFYTMLGAGDDSFSIQGYSDDTLIGNAGDDILNGGAGNDTYVYGGSFGNDTIIDPSGNDKILFTDVSLSDITVSGNVITCGENTILLSNEAKRTTSFTIEDKNGNTKTVEMPKATPMLFSLRRSVNVNTSKGIQVFGNAAVEIYDAYGELVDTITINEETAESVEYKDYGMAVLSASALGLTLPEGGYVIKITSEEKVSVWTVSDADNPTVAKQTNISEADLSDGSIIVVNTGEMVEEQLSVKIVTEEEEQSIYNEAPDKFTITADKAEIKAGETITMSVPELFANAVIWECGNGNVIITKNEDMSVNVTGYVVGEDTVRAYLPNDEYYSAEFTLEITQDKAPEVAVTCGGEVYDGSETATDSVAFDVVIPEGYDKAVFESQSQYSQIEDTSIFEVNSVGSHTINIYCKNSETGATTASFAFEFSQDSEAPEIHGALENAVYYTDRIITVTDNALDKVYVNGELSQTEEIALSEAGVYSITAKDKAGNESSLSFEIKAMPENVKQADYERVSQMRSDFEQVKYSLEEERMELIEAKLSILEEILYTVTEVTEFTVAPCEEGVSVSFKAANVPEDATVFTVCYGADGRMLELQLLTLEDGEASATFSATNAVSFKYFVWDVNIAPIVTTAERTN